MSVPKANDGDARIISVVVVGSLHYDIMVDAPDRPRKGETVAGLSWLPKFGGARCTSTRFVPIADSQRGKLSNPALKR